VRLDATRLKPACQPEAVTAGLEGQRNPRDRSLDRPPCRPPLNSGGALGRRLRSGCPLQLGLLRICGCAQAGGKTGVPGPVHLNPYTLKGSGS